MTFSMWWRLIQSNKPLLRTRFNCWNCGKFVWSRFPTMYMCPKCDCGWMADPPRERSEDL